MFSGPGTVFLFFSCSKNSFVFQKAEKSRVRADKKQKITETKQKTSKGNLNKNRSKTEISRPQNGEVPQTGTIVRPASFSAFFLFVFCLKIAHCYYY